MGADGLTSTAIKPAWSFPTRKSRSIESFEDDLRPGIGFWLLDDKHRPFYVIHEFVGGVFIQDPVRVERMVEFAEVDLTKASLFEVESVTGRDKRLFRIKEVANYRANDGTEIRTTCFNWKSLNFFLLKFLLRTHTALSFQVQGMHTKIG